MTAEQQLDWLQEHWALVAYGPFYVTLSCLPYPCVTAKTLEEAITQMMAQMGMVEGRLGEACQPLLLMQPE